MSVTCHSFLRFATLRVVSWRMTAKTIPKRTLDRKKREAVALKANMKKRKEQAKTEALGAELAATGSPKDVDRN
jgi:hypothetical protein